MHSNGTHTISTYRTHHTHAAFVPSLEPITITRSPEPGSGNYIPPLLRSYGRWVQTSENDPEAKALYRRHAQCRSGMNGGANGSMNGGTLGQRVKPRPFGGSGEKIVLVTHQADALIVFRKGSERGLGQGVHCSVFRNEGHFRSSSLIREAVSEWAWRRWPGERLYTYVGGQRVVSSNPGYCFKSAGWKRCGVTLGGMIVLELYPGST